MRSGEPAGSPRGRHRGLPTFGLRPMRLRCHAFPPILHEATIPPGNAQVCQPGNLRMWVKSCRATQYSQSLTLCPRSLGMRAATLTDGPRPCIPEGLNVPPQPTLLLLLHLPLLSSKAHGIAHHAIDRRAARPGEATVPKVS